MGQRQDVMLSTTNPFCLDSRHTVEYLLAALRGGSSKAPSPNGSGDFKEVDKRFEGVDDVVAKV